MRVFSRASTVRGAVAVFSAALVVSAALAGCSSSGKTASKSSTPFVFVDITDLTGSTAAFGIPILDGAKVAAAQLNAKGGILGHRIVVKSMNDPSNDPTTAINDLQSVLASGQQINLIYPGLTSAVGEALLPSVNQHNILAIGSLSAPTLNDPAKYPNLFLMATQSDQNVPPFVTIQVSTA